MAIRNRSPRPVSSLSAETHKQVLEDCDLDRRMSIWCGLRIITSGLCPSYPKCGYERACPLRRNRPPAALKIPIRIVSAPPIPCANRPRDWIETGDDALIG